VVVYRGPAYHRVYKPRYDKRRCIRYKFGKKRKLKRNREVVRVEENRIERVKGRGEREEERRGIERPLSNITSSPLAQRNTVLLSSNFFIITASGYNTRACATALLPASLPLAYVLRM
jgi:hypothetical protein